jgi:MFS transporter, DHA1 family, tetracycline resistance protein
MSALRRPGRGPLDPAIWLLIGSLVMLMGASALFPVVPLYVRHHGGGPVDVALFVAGPLLANAIVQLPAGRLVDRVGRRPVILGALGGFALLSTLLALDHGPLWLLAVLRAGQGVCSGAYIPAQRATLADLTPPERRAERFGQLQSFAMVGLLVGPALAVSTLLVTALRVPETSGMALAAARERKEEVHLARPGWWRRRGVLVPMLGLGAMGVVMSMYDVVWPLYLTSRGQGTVVIGLSIALFSIPILLLSPGGGRLADRSNRRRLMLAVDFGLAGATAAAYPFIHPLWLILAVGLVEAVSWVATEPILYAVLTDAAPLDARGRAMAVGGFSEFAGSAVGALGLGSLFAVGEGIPFWVGAGVLVSAGMMCVALLPSRRGAGSEGLPVGDDAEPGLLGAGVLEHGDDRPGADVDGAGVGGQLHEPVGA